MFYMYTRILQYVVLHPHLVGADVKAETNISQTLEHVVLDSKYRVGADIFLDVSLTSFFMSQTSFLKDKFSLSPSLPLSLFQERCLKLLFEAFSLSLSPSMLSPARVQKSRIRFN